MHNAFCFLIYELYEFDFCVLTLSKICAKISLQTGDAEVLITKSKLKELIT